MAMESISLKQGPISSLAVAVGSTFLAMKYGSGDGVDSKRTPGWNAYETGF
ncbi:hypothetical protein NC652_000194 [Populus alba x Populus x berolinensis]|nr:hypothetical protein NC652_000194 [Populus alba x Populus x berolinensis]